MLKKTYLLVIAKIVFQKSGHKSQLNNPSLSEWSKRGEPPIKIHSFDNIDHVPSRYGTSKFYIKCLSNTLRPLKQNR